MKFSAAEWIKRLSLEAHPEGGYYKEVYRSKEIIPADALPDRFGSARNCCTSIYYLLEQGQFSAFHRMKQDEIWHLYDGGPLQIHMLFEDGDYQTIYIGCEEDERYVLQGVAPAGCWFGAEPMADAPYALIGCTVSPGFDFADFELAKRADLLVKYPQHQALIRRLTRS